MRSPSRSGGEIGEEKHIKSPITVIDVAWFLWSLKLWTCSSQWAPNLEFIRDTWQHWMLGEVNKKKPHPALMERENDDGGMRDSALQRATMYLHTQRGDKLETSIWGRLKSNSVFFVTPLTIYILRNNRTFATTVLWEAKDMARPTATNYSRGYITKRWWFLSHYNWPHLPSFWYVSVPLISARATGVRGATVDSLSNVDGQLLSKAKILN